MSYWKTYLERTQQTLVDAHHGTCIVKFTAVVGCTEQCYELALGEEFVTIFYNLMRTADEVHVVLLQEARNYIWTKGKADTSIVLAPSGNVLVWVGPKEIAEKTAVGNLSWLARVLYRDSHVDCDMDLTHIGGSHDAPNLLHRVEIGAQAAVHGEDLLINDGGDGQAVEAVGESLPKLDVVASLALVVETVDAVDGSTLVVTAENEEVLGVLDLVRQQKADGLERLLATVDVVTEEEVVGLGREATVLEESE